MRNLQTSDIFAFVRLIDETGMRDELKNMVMKKDSIKDLTAESFGYDIIFMLLEKASTKKAEVAVYKFFGSLFEMSEDEVAKMDPVDFIDGVREIADIERWKNFFSSVAKLMESK